MPGAGAGAGAGAAEQFYSESEPEPEPKCFPGAGAGAGADQKCHGSASLIRSDLLDNAVICSDSKSALLALDNPNSTSELIFKIQSITRVIMQEKDIIFLWIPGHSDIPGNNEADRLAKSGLDLESITQIKLTPEEAIQPLRKAIADHFQADWNLNTKGRHLYNIKPKVQEWSSSFGSSRKHEVALARLRMGHTYLTHSYLFERDKTRPKCNRCNGLMTEVWNDTGR